MSEEKVLTKKEYIDAIQQNLSKTQNELEYFHGKDHDYGLKQTDWLLEKSIKNRLIYTSKTRERVQRPRKRVYWVNFGVNVGSEFNYPHFCVVIKEFEFTVIVVPLSSVKEQDADWKSTDNLIMEIGAINGLPRDQKSSYAMVNQIRSISKQRLTDYRESKSSPYIKLSLTNDQMDLIDQAIASMCKKLP